MDTALYPIDTVTSNHGIPDLDPSSYTAHRLKHATSAHLDLTSRRFFIGPIPEGWLSSNRKSWYKRRLELSTYSSRPASFSAAAGQGHHRRTMTDIDTRAMTARMNMSFPQPEDVDDIGEQDDDQGEEEIEEETGGKTADPEDEEDEVASDYQSAREVGELEPVATSVEDPTVASTVTKTPNQERTPQVANTSEISPRNTMAVAAVSPQIRVLDADNRVRDSQDISGSEGMTTTRSSSWRHSGLDATHDNLDTSSKTALLGSPSIKPQNLEPRLPPTRYHTARSVKSMDRHEPAPMISESHSAPHARKNVSTNVRFKVAEAVVDKQMRAGNKIDSVANRVGRQVGRRRTLNEGTIVKMEKMLARVDVTLQTLAEGYDENGSVKTETRPVDKWKEFMVVARKSGKVDEDDFRLQFYNTRVIPEIDDRKTSKKPVREIKLIPGSTHVNLFSSLDKSVVIWHPYRKGVRIVVMKAESTARSVEWYAFLRDALGWKRPATLEIFVPDLEVSLRVERPFEEVKAAEMEEDETLAAQKAAEAEHAVAGRIIKQCTEMLGGNPEWTNVLHKWQTSMKIGLAWKRYDRLEWIHGINEQKMYGSMAMQHSYELELRPKIHYPTNATSKKGKAFEEPAPIEGFLIRLTSQKGLHRRMGKTFFKRLYFHSNDNYLLFNRPANSTPPHPPRLTTISGTNVPSSHEILEKTPLMYDVSPYEYDQTSEQVRWLASHHDSEYINRHDREAYAERLRNHSNLASADGFINMTSVRQVRKMQWGAAGPVDETLSEGDSSDVNFHESVADTRREDGSTSNIDSDRIFEIVLHNDLVIRLQTYDRRTRDEWITRLRKLIKYWSLRKQQDMMVLRNVRATNLHTLKIDEAMEAELGQFGEKWEVTRSSTASPLVYNVCPIAGCRTISFSGELYLKTRHRSAFHKISAVLSAGKLLIFQTHLRTTSGRSLAHIHQEKTQAIDLKGCYVYSGLIVEDDLLYQNRTYDPARVGGYAQSTLPRVWREDGWTSSDVDTMCCFVVWMQRRMGWFRTAGSNLFGTDAKGDEDGQNQENRGRSVSIGGISLNSASGSGSGKRAKIKRVRQLGVPGRGMVFKCRSRAERDIWVQRLGVEIERVVEQEKWREEEEAGGGVRFAK